MTDNQTPPDWVLIEAAKRFQWGSVRVEALREHYHNVEYCGFRALCDMIAKHEQPPVDRKLLCAREAASEIARDYNYKETDARYVAMRMAAHRAIEL